VIAVVISRPIVAMTTMVIQTCFSHLEPQRCAAVEQDIARAEQQDDLVQRRIRRDIDQPERLRANRNPRDQEHPRHRGS